MLPEPGSSVVGPSVGSSVVVVVVGGGVEGG